MLVLGTTTLIISQDNRTNAWQRSATGSSLSTTEGGVARTLSQLSDTNNSILLTKNYDPINPETGTTYFGPDGVLSSGDEESVAMDEWSSCLSNPSGCALGPSGPPNISTFGNIGSNGQYTLKAYRYDSNTKTGTFLVEGQQNSSTSHVVVTISVDVQPDSYPSGLWISWNPKSDVGSDAQLETNIYDSTSVVDSDSSKVAKLTTQQVSIVSSGESVSYVATPDKAFPTLPPEGQTPPTTGVTGAYSISDISSSLTLPAPGETADASGVLTYHIAQGGGKSIRLSGGDSLTVGTGSETVVLYLDGGIDLTGGSSIIITPGSRLIIYAHGKISLSGDSSTSAVNNSGDADDAQLYMYTADEVTFSGGSGMRMFMFAPYSEIKFSSDSFFTGTLWSKSWAGSGSSHLIEEPLDLSKTKIIGFSGQNRMTGIISWQQAQL